LSPFPLRQCGRAKLGASTTLVAVSGEKLSPRICRRFRVASVDEALRASNDPQQQEVAAEV